MSYSIPHYLDASVASKLFSKEDGWEEIEQYVKKNLYFHCWVTEFVYYEILTVLKLKWLRREIGKKNYLNGIFILNAWVEDGLIQIDGDFDPKDEKHYLAVSELVEKYDIDYSDALQIYTVVHGKWNRSAYECETVFVSADSELVKAAIDCGLRTWHFGKDPPPT